MRILVCIKQVPDSDSLIRIDAKRTWIQIDEICDYRMNRLDEFALEEAVRIKEVFSDTKIDALSVGPEDATAVIKRSIGMGADNGILLETAAGVYHSSFATAHWIAEYAREKSYDLILTGAMSEDNMQGQVGPMIAQRLALPCATAVIFEKLAADRNTIYVERDIEGGRRDTLNLKLPALLTIQSGINTPRYPSLSRLLQANEQVLEKISTTLLSPPAFNEALVQLAYPRKTRSGTELKGTEAEKARQLVQILRERALLR